MSRQMHLVYMLPKGPTVHHHGMWRHPMTENRFLDPDWWEQIGRTLEAAKFDAVFCGDSQTLSDIYMRKGGQMHFLDPLPLAMVIARATKHLGIGVTLSTSYTEPYGLARSLGSLDLLSGGRIAWNVVTSVSQREADRYGVTLLPKAERYDRADEMLEACVRLWDSFGEDAFVMDKASGVFMNPSRVRPFTYEGKYVRTEGPLTVPRSPQGRPVIMQAGSSERGRRFAGRWAEMIFTLQHNLADMQLFYQDMKRRLVDAGRRQDDCKILVSVDPIIGETESIAREKQAYLNSLVDEELGVALTSVHTGVDLTQYPMDMSFNDLDIDAGSQGVLDILRSATEAQGLTLGEACRFYATSELCPQLVGTPAQVADQLEKYFTARGCDGFILTPVVMPGAVEDFTRSVVPILQERGLFRREYPGTTLRSTLSGRAKIRIP